MHFSHTHTKKSHGRTQGRTTVRTDRSLDQSIAWSFDRSVVRRSVVRSLGSVARWLDRSIAQSPDRSLDRSIVSSLDRSIACWLARSIARGWSRLRENPSSEAWAACLQSCTGSTRKCKRQPPSTRITWLACPPFCEIDHLRIILVGEYEGWEIPVSALP